MFTITSAINIQPYCICYNVVSQGGAKPDARVCQHHHGAICAASDPAGGGASLSGGVCGAHFVPPQAHHEDD